MQPVHSNGIAPGCARVACSDRTTCGPGPSSVTWKINREVIVVAGWGRAILLQLAHPAVAAGVHGHSSFRGSLLSSVRRLQSTVDAMLSLTFGDDGADDHGRCPASTRFTIGFAAAAACIKQ